MTSVRGHSASTARVSSGGELTLASLGHVGATIGSPAMVLGDGLFGPTVDDVFRVVIVVLGLLNVAVVLVSVVALRRYARLLLDVEQTTRESRNRLRDQLDEQLRLMAREMGNLSADLTELRSTRKTPDRR
jgi:hypothetical protein